eukprot:TRINITY_DN3502_c0_g1_i1.p1 TRINITY_DN3502_c0_g1~~TRINITY_DN3502_c0_g1_i1.p1  ORF type:complete len:390 (+),score=120.72 TRINITY_DN3502_c0_g1_i1:138-1307(+)
MSGAPIILDSGTGYLKIGYATEDFPRFTIPAIVGRPMLRFEEKVGNINIKPIMVGDEAAPVRSMLEINHPIEEGIVKDWDDMELVWRRGIELMKINPAETPVLLTEAIMNPLANRERMVNYMFEKLGFSKLQLGIQALLSLFAEGLLTATLLDSGDGVTHCIPIYEGTPLKEGIGRINIAGRHVTHQLIKLLFFRGYAFNSSADFETVREIKERFCFVSSDLALDRRIARETTAYEEEYMLPDQSLIKIGRERFDAPEILFTPALAGKEMKGCGELVFDSINKCPIDVRRALYKSIMISGGTSMFPGFPTRLENEMDLLYREYVLKSRDAERKIDIEIIDPPRRKYNVFIGGGVYTRVMQSRGDFWISKKEYDEEGTRVLSRIGESLTL